MSHIPQNIVVTNHLFCGLWIASGVSSPKHTFRLHPLRSKFVSHPPQILLSYFLLLFLILMQLLGFFDLP